jgi:CRP-like cAMP-binding protein
LLTRRDFLGVLDRNPKVERKVLRVLARRLAETSSDPRRPRWLISRQRRGTGPGDHSLRENLEAVAAAVGAWLPGVVAQAAPAAG